MFDYDVYALGGDGCMMEGISSEAASLAGHLKLSNLCWIYDNNQITIEGNTALAFSEDVATRFIAYGWNVTRVGDANDLEMLDPRLRDVQEGGRPPDADHRRQPHRLGRAQQAGHAARRTASRSARTRSGSTKQNYGWPEDAKFLVPDGVREHFADGIGKRGHGARARPGWSSSSGTRRSIPSSPTSCCRCSGASFRTAGTSDLPTFPADAKGVAGRDVIGTGAERARARTSRG